MHQYSVLVWGSPNATCGLLYWRNANVKNQYFCPIAIVAEKYNLTMQEDSGGGEAHFSFQKSFGSFFSIQLNKVGTRDYILNVNLRSINFLTVTNPPSPSNGVETFVTPFDLATWMCLLVITLSLAGFLNFAIRQDDQWVSSINVAIAVVSILLGQVLETTGKAYASGKVALVLITFWLFGNLFLTSNLYQGSIYSCLAVLVPPQTPRGVEDLLNWDVPMVAMDTVYSTRSRSYQTFLKFFIIPELITSYVKNSKFVNFLTEFQARVLSLNKAESDMIHKTVSGNTSRTHKTIVLLFFEDKLDDVVKQIKILGNRRSVKNKGDSPFRVIRFQVGFGSLLAPYFGKEWGRMFTTGLNLIWSKVHSISLYFHANRGQLEKRKRFVALQNYLWNQKDTMTLHEGNSISIELIRPVFTICAVSFGLALIGFVLENGKFIIRRFKS
ncbi:uncharacterized protein LOC110850132 [Folsomia candida]|uniref:uncharacterized protein LOC110850132 n=1 Tax=Folsomia candida TaxID=158441 RepID=UPI00160541FC|nr:uncharacterized protein LOC110850132 [Folsomia candida]